MGFSPKIKTIAKAVKADEKALAEAVKADEKALAETVKGRSSTPPSPPVLRRGYGIQRSSYEAKKLHQDQFSNVNAQFENFLKKQIEFHETELKNMKQTLKIFKQKKGPYNNHVVKTIGDFIYMKNSSEKKRFYRKTRKH